MQLKLMHMHFHNCTFSISFTFVLLLYRTSTEVNGYQQLSIHCVTTITSATFVIQWAYRVDQEAVASWPWGPGLPKYFEKMKKFKYFGVKSCILHRFCSRVIYPLPLPSTSRWNNFFIDYCIGWGRKLLRAPSQTGRHKNKASEKVKITIKCINVVIFDIRCKGLCHTRRHYWFRYLKISRYRFGIRYRYQRPTTTTHIT